MQVSNKGITFIKEQEGFRPLPYLDAGGISTIGYGHVIRYNEDKLKSANLNEYLATQILVDDIKQWENYLSCISMQYKVTFNQNQFDALCSFCFNTGRFKTGMLERFANKDLNEVGKAILLYNKVKDKVIEGLTLRRKKEQRLFLEGIYVS